MNILAWIGVGLVAGWVASQLMRGGGYGLIGDVVMGVAGGLLGGYLASTFFGMPESVNGINGSMVVAIIGAVILIAALRLISPGRRAF
jgi:uncharacterized membrane protein YeaQ/YmgE (transglycosylase-associated protein family)